ncbi:hypothetical protein KBC79_01505 [Candidatus Woesebacteria bacterium]|nr:hypothetical protein [Candidatus Woesebacteria bacterium]
MKDGLAAFQETGNKLKQEVEAEKAIVEEQRTQVLASLESLRGLAGIGMSHVDKADIRPPQVLVVQKSSNLDEMVDINGKKPSFGQFFNTGSREIMDEFDCYVILAKKGFWTDRRKPEEGQKEMYTMIGVMQGSMRIFGMMLRRSSRYALNNLFSVAIDQKYPMFAFNVHVEVKKLSNADGEWVVPVFRIGQLEQDAEILGQLMDVAKQFDQQADKIDLTEVEPDPQEDVVYASDGEDTPF